MPTNAPYSGGFSPGAQLFAVDGDFTVAAPCGLPHISNPFQGDTFPSLTSIVLLNSSGVYQEVPLGSGYNIQPFSANQTAIILEQEFMVAEAYHVPLPLNTPYDPAFAIGWQNTYVDLASCFLVEEGPLHDMGGGLVKFRRRYANLPPTRNVMESYVFTFPSLQNVTNTRVAYQAIVPSRVQYDFYVYDYLDLLSLPLFTAGGHRLNAATGLQPPGLLLDQIKYYQDADALANHSPQPEISALTTDTIPVYDPIPTGADSDYNTWITNKWEMVAEASSFGPGPWLGNIYCRKTRFVVAQ